MEECEKYYKALLKEEKVEFLTTEQHEHTIDQQVTKIATEEVSRAVKGIKNGEFAELREL